MGRFAQLAEAVRPSDWGAEVDYDTWTDPYTQDDKIIIHYGGNAVDRYRDGVGREAEVLRAYENWHFHGRGWRGLAYGWAIGMSGTIYAARQWNSYGAHKGDLDLDGVKENEEGIPVLFLLGGEQEPTTEAIDAFGRLRAYLEGAVEGDLPLYGHKEIAKQPASGGTATACPGRMMDLVESQRKKSPNGRKKKERVAPPGMLRLDDVTEAEWTWVAQQGLIKPINAGPYYADPTTPKFEKEHAAVVALKELAKQAPSLT